METRRSTVVSVIIAVVLLAPSAMAACQASIIGHLSIHDVSMGQVSDPVPLLPGHAVDGIQNNSTTNGVAPPAGGYNRCGEGVAGRGAGLLIYDRIGAAAPGF